MLIWLASLSVLNDCHIVSLLRPDRTGSKTGREGPRPWGHSFEGTAFHLIFYSVLKQAFAQRSLAEGIASWTRHEAEDVKVVYMGADMQGKTSACRSRPAEMLGCHRSLQTYITFCCKQYALLASLVETRELCVHPQISFGILHVVRQPRTHRAA